MLGFHSKIVAVVWLGILAIVLVESLVPYGSPSLAQHYGDIVLHLICFFFLAFLPTANAVRIRQGLFLALLMAVLGAGVEMAQLYIPGRDCSPADIFTNNIGVMLGVGVGGLWRWKQKANGECSGEPSS